MDDMVTRALFELSDPTRFPDSSTMHANKGQARLMNEMMPLPLTKCCSILLVRMSPLVDSGGATSLPGASCFPERLSFSSFPPLSLLFSYHKR